MTNGLLHTGAIQCKARLTLLIYILMKSVIGVNSTEIGSSDPIVHLHIH